MNEQLTYARIRMLLSGMFEQPTRRNKSIDIDFDRKVIRYSKEFEVRTVKGRVVLIKEPSTELLTDESLVDMGFGC